jgi:hypothetical protein
VKRDSIEGGKIIRYDQRLTEIGTEVLDARCYFSPRVLFAPHRVHNILQIPPVARGSAR